MFPPEIFCEIFSFLTSEARALLACGQAHPIFTQLIEPSLYAHVIVHNHEASDDEDGRHLKLKLYQFSALLSDNPRILNYLRSLCVDLFRFHADDGAMKEITTILPGLKLERIQLTFSHDIISWETFPITFHTAFVACISTSLMKEICFDKVYDIPLNSFAHCAGLKRLTLWGYAIPPSNISCKFPHLEALEFSNWKMPSHGRPYELFSWLLTHACGLRSLTLITSKRLVMRRLLPRILAISATSLVNLSIYYSISSDTDPVEIDFPGLPSLERLRLCVYNGMLKTSDNYTVRRAIITITQILQNASSLQHLTLIICHQCRWEGIIHVDWSLLSDFLSSRRSSFQHTDLYIRAVTAGGEVPFDEVVPLLSRYDNLMSLVEAGYVSIKENMNYDDDDTNTFRLIDSPDPLPVSGFPPTHSIWPI